MTDAEWKERAGSLLATIKSMLEQDAGFPVRYHSLDLIGRIDWLLKEQGMTTHEPKGQP